MHWTMTVKDRETGWLDPLFHARFREVMLHMLIRYRLTCPVYCLMPEHVHLLWMGVAQASDQLNAIRLFRRILNMVLRPLEFQKQPFDHVLREKERERGAFASVAFYILENPVRKALVAAPSEYPFCGCVVPGYPVMDVFGAEFWETFWRIHERASRVVSAAS